jgi:undecaprenyl diphosphate synthase
MMKKSAFPKHVAIIPDGNRRWAKKRHLPPFLGHRRGVEVFEKICDAAFSAGVEVLTFYTFSTENWKRSKREVRYLFRLLEETFTTRLDRLHQQGLRLVVSGTPEEFPDRLQRCLRAAVEKTRANTKGTVNLCLNYGGRSEIVDAVRRIMARRVPAKKITADMISANLYHPELPEPDMIIRTSGEQRLSGYLLWQSEYSELYFEEKLWPDFAPADLRAAFLEFARRKRRFGS